MSRASTNVRSQLKHQKLRVGSCIEEVLKWFNYPRARVHPGCKVSCQGVPNRLALLLCLCFVEASLTGEKAVLCYKVNWLIASLPSFHSNSVFACSTWISCCRERTVQQGHRWMCANLWCLMSWHPKCIRRIAATQRTYLQIHTNLAWWAVTQRTSKNHKLSKLGGGRLHGYGRLPGTIRYSSHVETWSLPSDMTTTSSNHSHTASMWIVNPNFASMTQC